MECISATQWGEAGQWEKGARPSPALSLISLHLPTEGEIHGNRESSESREGARSWASAVMGARSVPRSSHVKLGAKEPRTAYSLGVKNRSIGHLDTNRASKVDR